MRSFTLTTSFVPPHCRHGPNDLTPPKKNRSSSNVRVGNPAPTPASRTSCGG